MSTLWTNIAAFLSNTTNLTTIISIILTVVLAGAAIANILNSVSVNIYTVLETEKIDGGSIRFYLRIINSGPATSRGVFWALVGNLENPEKMETIRAAVTPPMIPNDHGIVVERGIASGILDHLNGNPGLPGQFVDLSKFKSVSVFVRKHKGNWSEGEMPTELLHRRCYSEFSFHPINGHLIGRHKVWKKLPEQRDIIYDARWPTNVRFN